MTHITYERGSPNFQIPPLERSPSAQPCNYVRREQNGYYAAEDYCALSSLKLSRRLMCNVRFVSTFNLQRGRAFVVGITNFEQIGCLCKGKISGRPRVSEENVRRIQESSERSPRQVNP